VSLATGCGAVVNALPPERPIEVSTGIPDKEPEKNVDPTQADYELIPTEKATETVINPPSLTPEPTAVVTEIEPVNINDVIDLTKLSQEQIEAVNVEMIKRIEQFKNGEICGVEVMKENGLYSNPNLVDIEPHLGILSASEPAIDFQACILGVFVKNVKENDDKEYQNLYLMVGYEKKPDRERAVSLVRNELGKLIEAKYVYRVKYVHGKNTVLSLSTDYSFSEKEDVLALWKTSINNPVTFQFGLYEEKPFSPEDVEYLKSIGTDSALLEKCRQNYNLSLELSKGLAFSGYCKKDEFDSNNGYLCDMDTDTPPTEIRSLTEALDLMDGRLLPNTNIWKLRGAGPQY